MSEQFNISETLVKELLLNNKRDRRWRNIRFFIILLIIIALFLGAFTFFKGDGGEHEGGDYVSLVRLNGVIMAGADFSAFNVLPILEDAFSDKKAKGVILEINSGGGSPVQASIIESKILELKKKYNKKVVVVGEDLLASGAYLVAMGGDTIYVNNDTITGSIGVIMEGFGFVGAMDKLGVTRRVYTAGANKDQLDSFLPVTEKDKAKVATILDQAHDNFIDIVTASRGEKITGDDDVVFSGDFWVGKTALTLGLVDGIGNTSQVMSDEFDVDKYVDYSKQPSIIDVIFKGAKSELNKSFSFEQQGHLSAKF
jgi:protease IV